MIVVYSGFWVLYFQNFGSVLWYLRDFVDRSPVSAAMTSLFRSLGLPWTFTFDAEHVTVVNAGTIILLQVLVSRLVKDWKALPTMVTGMALGALGFLLLASSRNPWVFVLGIAVFSMGDDGSPEARPGQPGGAAATGCLETRPLRVFGSPSAEPGLPPRGCSVASARPDRRAGAHLLAPLRRPRRGRGGRAVLSPLVGGHRVTRRTRAIMRGVTSRSCC
jgi:hypothetical protein